MSRSEAGSMADLSSARSHYKRAPSRGDADWVDEYAFVGDNDGRRLATLQRKTTAANPWRSVVNSSVRMKKLPTKEVVQVLDIAARQRAWFCLDMPRDNAVAMLENLQSDLPDGTFVVSTSRREFAMLTYIAKKTLHTVALDAGVGGIWIKFPDVKSPTRFKTLTELVTYYAAKRRKGMEAALNADALETVLKRAADDGWFSSDQLLEEEEPQRQVRGGAMANPGYSSAASMRGSGVMANPGYVAPPVSSTGAGPSAAGPSTSAGSSAAVATTESEGFIQISKTSFTPADGIYGVTFQPCQTDQWFFMGLSNILQNHHGRRDCHFDDIDFCIAVMGHGKATARENEDEVGPYIEYKAGDTFTIVVNPKKKIVEYAKNKKVFYTSILPDNKLPLWALQAFHPINGGQLLIRNSNWMYKLK
eukprot:m.211114 g.211114  ORF g.211114 m.211114 type:complete len:419 (-) comp25369_c0_seq1:29-1285(-)